ncbi:MAG: hypothetical protein WBA99_09480, partial [Nodosilinea sp.]
QSWLPLDASQIEVLEGRYRVMAHTSQTNTPVRIQISQRLDDSPNQRSASQRESAQRRTLRRQSETNSTGLMVVMPFTRLRQGTWDIQCASGGSVDEVNSLSKTHQPWCYAVQLRVVGQDSADDEDWFADDGRDSGGAIAASYRQSEPANPSDSLVAGAASTPDIDLEATAAAMDAFQAQRAAGLTEETLPYGFTLSQTALLGSTGESLGLTATVTGAIPNAALTLVVRLSDPQTATSVALAPVPLAVKTLPSTVTLRVTVPPGLSTRLLLGDMGLLVGTEVVALQQFTVTVDVASLFDAIANQAETDADLDVVFPPDTAEAVDASPPPNLDLKTWDMAGRTAPPREMPILTLPRSGTALPPKIYYPSPHEAGYHQPTLPSVGQPKPSSPAARAPASREPAADPNRGLSLPPIPPPQVADPLAALSQPSAGSSSKRRGPEPQLISHEAMGFKDLKLQDRFWARLNELAVNLQQEALETALEPPSEAAAISVDEAAEAEPAFIPFAGEVVIYDDEDPALTAVSPTATVEESAEAITPPMPTLVLPEGELTAGEPVLVTLRVPFHPNRLYLKVWITDPQTRSLADEPRQVMNLLPNGQGQLEGNLQLTVPLGCLEARFEAISIDLLTQQESYKASVNRAITLPGLPAPGLDEFQF